MPAFIKTDTHITVVFDDGKNGTMFSSDPSFNELCTSLKQNSWDEVHDLMFPVEPMKRAISSLSDNRVTIDAGIVTLDGNPMHSTLTDRMLEMHSDGFDVAPLSNFLENLMDNPSYRAVNELYGFLEKSNLPITDDGHFYAYKRVDSNFKDMYTHKMDNSIGQLVSMPRNKVNEDKHQTCSTGLHFCAREYLSSYGTGGSSKIVMVKINPRDVVSIPTDYNNAKGRCCQYKVIRELGINNDDNNSGRLPTEEIEGNYVKESDLTETESNLNKLCADPTGTSDDQLVSMPDINKIVNSTVDLLADMDPALSEILKENANRLIGDNTLLNDEPLPESSLSKTPTKIATSMAVQKLSPIKSNGEYVSLETFMSAREAMKRTGIDSSSIIKVCKGSRQSAGGFKWRWKITEAPVGSIRQQYMDIDDASREDEEED